MTQHPFDRQYSKLTAPANKNELKYEEAEAISGGSIPSKTYKLEERTNFPAYPSCSITEAGVWEGGGKFLEL